jgi:hypothetical protein
MQKPPAPQDKTCFFILVTSPEAEVHAHFLISSLRTFGGDLRACPIWVFLPNQERVSTLYTDLEDVHVFPTTIEEAFGRYYFTYKVHTCALAEEMAAREFRSLIWLSPQCLIVNPPDLLALSPSFDAAFRPVHIRNVGLPVGEPLDSYWREVYRRVGIDDPAHSIESFVDQQSLRPYFNSHLFSINPAKGVLRTWLTYFKRMITDQKFQSGPCQDEVHQIFLHQAILSALLPKMLVWERIRILPPEYSYPLHLHHEVPEARRPASLNDLVCPVYEDTYRFPDTLNGLEVHTPLKEWLIRHDLSDLPDGGNQV